MTLRLALVGGPMYDRVYSVLDGEDVEVVVHASHPELNRAAASMLGAGERIDVLSTHSKYAPWQAPWLRPLTGLVEARVIDELSPAAVERCRFRGVQYCLPRNVDVRVLWARSDRVESVPKTWDDLVASTVVFGFPGRESGLFGTFFEIVFAQGGRLFDNDLRPTMRTPQAVRAVEILCELSSRCPAGLPDWHYDEVDAALLDGRLDMAAAWPGGYGRIRESALAGRLTPHPYLGGSEGVVSYAGVHAWAIPTTCGDVPGAVALLTRLLGAEAGALEVASGGVTAHAPTLQSFRPLDATDARRMEITRETIASGMITYPPLADFPAVEDAGWSAINAALRGDLSPPAACDRIQQDAEAALGDAVGM